MNNTYFYQKFKNLVLFVTSLYFLLFAVNTFSQTVKPSDLASCTVTAMNRTAPVNKDFSFEIYNMPGAGVLINSNGTQIPPSPYRARAVCSDGTVGQTKLAFPTIESLITFTGEIIWGQNDPIPSVLNVTAPKIKLLTAETTLLDATAIFADGTSRKFSDPSTGVMFATTNPLLATVDVNGEVLVKPEFASGSSARVLAIGSLEGVAGSVLLQLGPLGGVTGKVLRADGVSLANGVQVTLIRDQPREQAGTVQTDGLGNFNFDEISAGSYSISVFDPVTKARGVGYVFIANQDETSQTEIKLNGVASLKVKVVDANEKPIPNAEIGFSSMSGFNDIRFLKTDNNGWVVLDLIPAGYFVATGRDTASRLSGVEKGKLVDGESKEVVIKLQPVASFMGKVFAADGITIKQGVQVRLISASKGLISQTISDVEGGFEFDTVTLADAPYTLDAMLDGRVRGREQGLVLPVANQVRQQNIIFVASGQVTGKVLRVNGQVAGNINISLQSLIGQKITLTTKANENGEFRFDVVPIGEFRVQASDGGQVAIVKSEITSEDEVKNVQLTMASVGLKGRVFNRDKISPVGAGVKVFLQPGSQETVTDSDGYYGFVITQPSDYVVEVKDELGNRGRTSIKISSIDPTNPSVANVAYIGIGRVEGVVNNASGESQAGVEVTLTALSIFGYAPSLKTITNAQGQFFFENQYVGKLTLTAAQSTTGLRGEVSAELKNEAEVLVANIDLAATASIAGTIYDNLGSTVIPNANLILSNIYTGKTWQMQADAQGKYLFSNLPLGSYSLKATKELDGDTGVATVQVNTLNEQKVLNLRLQGLGNLQVNVKKADGTNVAGATVTLSRTGYYRNAVTNEAGIAIFGVVPAGVYSASSNFLESGQFLNASASVRLPAQENTTAVIKLPAPSPTNPSGTMTVYGTVFKNGSPITNIPILLRESFESRSQISDANGNYKFENHPLGLIGDAELRVTNAQGVLYGIKYFNPQVANETKRVDIPLIATGNVKGLITDVNNKPMAGLRLVLSKNDNTFTGSWTESTNSSGQFNIKDVTAGSFTLRAYNLQYTLVGQVDGLLKTEGEVVFINFQVFDNLTELPVALNDANEMSFSLLGNGELTAGINGALEGITNSGVNDQGINRLEILSKSNYIPFTNNQDNNARKFENNQSFEVFGAVPDLPEIKVKRQTYIPKTGYFARHLEVLENTGAQTATVSLRLTSNISAGRGGAKIVDTSNNDAVLDSSNNSKLPDNWLIVDDTVDADPFLDGIGNTPAVALLIDGVNGEHNASELKQAVLGQGTKLQWSWQNIKVEPGQRVAFMHFTVQQLTRLAARLSVQRLEQLPPEALEGLVPEDLGIIKNFVVSNNGLSILEALPSTIETEVIGNVFASDGLTKLPNADVVFKSNNPFYGRTLITKTNSNGLYSFKSYTSTTKTISVGIAQADFNIKVGFGNVTSVNNIGYFEENVKLSKKDIILNGSSILKGTVYRKNGTIVTSGYVTLNWVNKNGSKGFDLTDISNLGTYAFNALETLPTVENTSKYSLTALNGQLKGSVGDISLITDNVTIKDIYLEPVGGISGIVKNSNTGEPIINQPVIIENIDKSKIYQLLTDTSGRFIVVDLPIGKYTASVNLGNGNKANTSVEVMEDKTSEITLVTQKLIKLNLEVKYARGIVAANSFIYRDNINVGKTSDKGAYSIELPISTAAYNFEAEHPQNSSLIISKNITLDGSVDTITENLLLPPAGTLKGYIKLLDGVPVQQELVRLFNNNGQLISYKYSDESGIYEFNGVAPGKYLISVVNSNSLLEGNASVEIIEDGQLLEKDIFIQENRVSLPIRFFDSNKFSYTFNALNSSIYLNAGDGWGDYYEDLSLTQLKINNIKLAPLSFGTFELNKRQVVMRQSDSISGVNVIRKVFLPEAGSYAARYLEVFENSSNQDLYLDVEIESKLPLGVTIKNTSSGGSLKLNDNWVVTDDANGADPFLQVPTYDEKTNNPALAFVFASNQLPNSDDKKLPLVVEGNLDSRVLISANWQKLKVPANSKVTIMHFAAPQVGLENAKYAAERLSQLPNEALFGLTDSERNSIINFKIPSNGLSTIPDLPELNGAIQGTVFEGNGETVVPNTLLQIQSTHPLFARVRSTVNCGQLPDQTKLKTDSNGFYRLESGSSESIPLPVGWEVNIGRLTPCVHPKYSYFNYEEGYHPQSFLKIESQSSAVGSVTNPTIKDLKFDSGIILGTVIGGIGFEVASGSVEINYKDQLLNKKLKVDLNNLGQYEMRGLPIGNFELVAKTNLNGSVLTGLKEESIQVGVTKVIDINLENTGAVQGIVTLEGGELAEGYSVRITSINNIQFYRDPRLVDAFGKYNFYGLPVGRYELSIYEQRTQVTTKQLVEIFHNQITNQNIVVNGSIIGSVKLKVINASGTALPGAGVYLKTIASNEYFLKGYTDALGLITLTVPRGNYSIKILKNGNPSVFSEVITDEITTSNSIQNKTITSLIGTVKLKIINTEGKIDRFNKIYLKTINDNDFVLITTSESNEQVNLNVPIGKYTIKIVEYNNYSSHDQIYNGVITADNFDQNVTINLLIGVINLNVINFKAEVFTDAYVYLKTKNDVSYINYGRLEAAGNKTLSIPLGSFEIKIQQTFERFIEFDGVVTENTLLQNKTVHFPLFINGEVQLVNTNNDSFKNLRTVLHYAPLQDNSTNANSSLEFRDLLQGKYTISTIDKNGNLWLGELNLPAENYFNGQVLMSAHPYPSQGYLSSVTNKHYYLIPNVNGGDKLSVWVRGRSINDVGYELYAAKAQLIKVDSGDVAGETIGFNSFFSYSHDSNLLDFKVPTTGQYKIAVQIPSNLTDRPGAYQIEVSKNDQPVRLISQVPTIKGVVKSLGNPLVDYWVKIKAGVNTPLAMEKQVKTGLDGSFEVNSLSLGDYQIEVISSVDNKKISETTGVLLAEEVKVENIDLNVNVKIINVKVTVSKINLNNQYTLDINYEDQSGLSSKTIYLQNNGAEFKGEAKITGIGNSLNLSVKLKNAVLSLEKNESISLLHWNEETDFVSINFQGNPSLTGTVKDEQGTTFPYSTVYLLSEDGAVIENARTDDNGAFAFDTIQSSTNYKLVTEDFNYGLIEKNINLVPNASEVHDLIFVTKAPGTLAINPQPFVNERRYHFTISSIFDESFYYFDTNRQYREYEYSDSGLIFKLPPGEYNITVNSAIYDGNGGGGVFDTPLCGKARIKVQENGETISSIPLTPDGTDFCWGVYVN